MTASDFTTQLRAKLLVDPVDSDLLENVWSMQGNGSHMYAHRYLRKAEVENYDYLKRQGVYLHRIILQRAIVRDLLDGEVCDHINGNTLDNRRVNLRVTDPKGNATNRTESLLKSNSACGFKGVYFEKNTGKYKATITANRKQFHLGRFDTPEDAYAAYCEAAQKHHGRFSRIK